MLTIGELVRHNQRYWAERTAYVDGRRRTTWSEFGVRTDALGRALREMGVGVGDRLGMLAPDSTEIAELFVACAKIGAVRVGYNHRLSVGEVAQLVDDSEPAVLFVHQDYEDLAQQPLERAACLPRVVMFGGGDTEYEELIARHTSHEQLEMTPAELLMICYTTGSTGLPKGALYTHQNVLRSMLHIALCEGAAQDDVWMHTMPAGGVPILHLCRNLYHGSTMVILGKWDPERALDLIARERITRTVLVPTMLTSLLNSASAGRTDTSSIRQLEYGASPLPPAIIRQAVELFRCPFLQMYGTTELTGMASMLFPADHELGMRSDPEILASAGRPLPYVETKFVAEDGVEVPVGEIGELAVRSDLVIPGYWRAPEKYDEVVREGWLYTGDLGRRDERGFLYLVDRKKFRIKSGGYNIYPVEVENVLAEHPAVREVCVVGVPDDRWGERVHAVVVLRDDTTVGPEQLIDFCRGNIAHFKAPKSVDVWTELPKGATGKIQKRAVLDRVVHGV